MDINFFQKKYFYKSSGIINSKNFKLTVFDFHLNIKTSQLILDAVSVIFYF